MKTKFFPDPPNNRYDINTNIYTNLNVNNSNFQLLFNYVENKQNARNRYQIYGSFKGGTFTNQNNETIFVLRKAAFKLVNIDDVNDTLNVKPIYRIKKVRFDRSMGTSGNQAFIFSLDKDLKKPCEGIDQVWSGLEILKNSEILRFTIKKVGQNINGIPCNAIIHI